MRNGLDCKEDKQKNCMTKPNCPSLVQTASFKCNYIQHIHVLANTLGPAANDYNMTIT